MIRKMRLKWIGGQAAGSGKSSFTCFLQINKKNHPSFFINIITENNCTPDLINEVFSTRSTLKYEEKTNNLLTTSFVFSPFCRIGLSFIHSSKKKNFSIGGGLFSAPRVAMPCKRWKQPFQPVSICVVAERLIEMPQNIQS